MVIRKYAKILYAKNCIQDFFFCNGEILYTQSLTITNVEMYVENVEKSPFVNFYC